MDLALRAVLKAFALPPLSLFAVLAFAVLVRRKRPRLARALFVAVPLVLWTLCMPIVSSALLRSLQPAGPVDVAATRAGVGAIVVLGGDHDPWAPEYGGPTLGPMTLQRVRYGAHLARETGLPVLVAGGIVRRGMPPLSDLMAEVMEDELGVPVRWRETRSANTEGNARHSRSLLEKAGVTRVYLVTSAWHVPRARGAFERVGLEVVPAPTGFRAWPDLNAAAFLPSARGLRESTWAIHEWIGRAWYAIHELGS